MKTNKIIGLAFLVIGGLILTGGLFWMKSTISFVSRAQNIKGEISKQREDLCETTKGEGSSKRTVSYTCYQPFVKYEWQGQTKEAGMSERTSSSYTIGKAVDLLIDPTSPDNPKFKGMGIWIGPIFLSTFGSIFFLVGFLLMRSYLRTQSKIKLLKTSGVLIKGKVTFCGLDQSVKVNGRHPWKLEASWIHPATKKVYLSSVPEELWYDPVQMGQVSMDGEVQIKYNPKNPEQSMVILENTNQLNVAS